MITAGQVVNIKPEWQDDGDEEYTFTAMETPHPDTGYFKARVTAKVPDAYSFPSIMELHASHVVGGG